MFAYQLRPAIETDATIRAITIRRGRHICTAVRDNVPNHCDIPR